MLGNFFSVTLLPVVPELPRESFGIGFGNPAIAARITLQRTQLHERKVWSPVRGLP